MNRKALLSLMTAFVFLALLSAPVFSFADEPVRLGDRGRFSVSFWFRPLPSGLPSHRPKERPAGSDRLSTATIFPGFHPRCLQNHIPTLSQGS